MLRSAVIGDSPAVADADNALLPLSWATTPTDASPNGAGAGAALCSPPGCVVVSVAVVALAAGFFFFFFFLAFFLLAAGTGAGAARSKPKLDVGASSLLSSESDFLGYRVKSVNGEGDSFLTAHIRWWWGQAGGSETTAVAVSKKRRESFTKSVAVTGAVARQTFECSQGDYYREGENCQKKDTQNDFSSNQHGDQRQGKHNIKTRTQY